MAICAIYGCSNTFRKTKGTNIRYFRFPKNPELSKAWIIACRRRDKFTLKYACVCSIHFMESDFQIPLRQQLLNYQPRNKSNLKVDAVPSLHLPSSSTTDVGKQVNNDKRTKRLAQRHCRTELENILKSHENEHSTKVVANDVVTGNTVSIETDRQHKGVVIPQNPSIIQDIAISDQTTIGSSPRKESTVAVVPFAPIESNQKELNALKERNSLLEQENHMLRKRCAEFQVENEKLLMQLKKGDGDSHKKELSKMLEPLFTPGQIRLLRNPNQKKTKWSTEDIARAMSLRRISVKAYQYLRCNGYPLPELSTLRRWAQKFNFSKSHGDTAMTTTLSTITIESSDETQKSVSGTE